MKNNNNFKSVKEIDENSSSNINIARPLKLEIPSKRII